MGYGATKVENVSQCQQLSVQPAGLGPPQRLSICRLADIKDQGECAGWKDSSFSLSARGIEHCQSAYIVLRNFICRQPPGIGGGVSATFAGWSDSFVSGPLRFWLLICQLTHPSIQWKILPLQGRGTCTKSSVLNPQGSGKELCALIAFFYIYLFPTGRTSSHSHGIRMCKHIHINSP